MMTQNYLMAHQQAGLLPQGSSSAVPAAHGGDLHRLKICGVPASTTDARLRQLFELCGKVSCSWRLKPAAASSILACAVLDLSVVAVVG